jgi:hypothetical protein
MGVLHKGCPGFSTGRVLRDAPLRAQPGPVPLQYQVSGRTVEGGPADSWITFRLRPETSPASFGDRSPIATGAGSFVEMMYRLVLADGLSGEL